MLGLAFGVSSVEGSGLTLHFDKLSVLSLPKEAALLHPAFKGGARRRRMGQGSCFCLTISKKTLSIKKL
jgi:hypothetical protein